jgi:hypothetical protein
MSAIAALPTTGVNVAAVTFGPSGRSGRGNRHGCSPAQKR